jgi:hypothetical protein
MEGNMFRVLASADMGILKTRECSGKRREPGSVLPPHLTAMRITSDRYLPAYLPMIGPRATTA